MKGGFYDVRSGKRPEKDKNTEGEAVEEETGKKGRPEGRNRPSGGSGNDNRPEKPEDRGSSSPEMAENAAPDENEENPAEETAAP